MFLSEPIEGTKLTGGRAQSVFMVNKPASIPEGNNYIGAVGSKIAVVDVTLSLDTSAYAIGDVLSNTVLLPNVMRIDGGTALLQSVKMNDKDNQGAALTLVFLDGNYSLGTRNAAPNISDADADHILGIVSIIAGDWFAFGTLNRTCTKSNINLALKAAAGTRSLYLATLSQGTPTYTANGLTVRLGFIQN